MNTLFTSFYLLFSIFLFVYSYGFLDFNLTLSSHPLFLRFVAPIQHLIYFDRPHSAQVYIALFALAFLCYLISLLPRYLPHKFPWRPFLILIAILTLAYPMLSYDVFNYMFHAKILWFYHANPHLHAPLEYQGDLWLRFMRWVHTPSAYGPVFTAIESPAYLLGLGKFVPTLYLMKSTMAGFFVWCVYLVGRIGEELKFSRRQIIFSQVLLAFNPFFLFELVVNGHNDAVMIAFFLLALLFSLRRRLAPSLISLLASVGVKYLTALTLPIYLIRHPRFKILFVTLILLLPVVLSPGRFQPWYLTWSLIPAVLINTRWSRLWIYLTSLAGLIYYVPYIGTGFWNNSLPFVSFVLYSPMVICAVYFLLTKPRVSL